MDHSPENTPEERKLHLEHWDHKPGDPTSVGCLDLATGEDLRLLAVNQPSEYVKLPEDGKAILQAWILQVLCYSDATGSYSSYNLKHVFQDSEGGFYVTNGQFKGAMLATRYEPLDKNELNWRFGYRPITGEFARRAS